jgi:hypothetical protein
LIQGLSGDTGKNLMLRDLFFPVLPDVEPGTSSTDQSRKALALNVACGIFASKSLI